VRHVEAKEMGGHISAIMEQADGEEGEKVQRRFRREAVRSQLGFAKLQCDANLLDECTVVIYRGRGGQKWARPYSEFMDGRFERLK
jgi:hypothetical protein